MNKLDPRIEQGLRGALDAVARRGKLLSKERLQESYATFRDHFGPDKLGSLDGEALLETMHAHGNKESLVYWLEFKNDAEFPGPMFGSIAGGSAHKFGLFRRKDTAQWVAGSPQNEVNITQVDAVAVAREHRDHLLACVALLEKLPGHADDSEYKRLQVQLSQVAADIVGLAWAHKYLSLLFPDKLDDFHNQEWQRFNLIKLLQLPPEGDGLYLAAGCFVSLASQFGWPMNHLTTALNERNGRPEHFWRIGTRLDGESIWPKMRDGGYAAIGWPKLGDLSVLGSAGDLKEPIRKKLGEEYEYDAKTLGRKAGEIRNFVQRIAEGDVVVAADGQTILGLGRVPSGSQYRYEDNAPRSAPHRRPVEWISTAEWKLPQPDEGKLTTVFQLKKYETNLIDIEKRLLDPNPALTPKPIPMAASRLQRLSGIPGRIQAILERKGQAILFGPPGTGKTFWARNTALDLSAVHTFGRLFNELSAGEKAESKGPRRIRDSCDPVLSILLTATRTFSRDSVRIQTKQATSSTNYAMAYSKSSVLMPARDRTENLC